MAEPLLPYYKATIILKEIKKKEYQLNFFNYNKHLIKISIKVNTN